MVKNMLMRTVLGAWCLVHGTACFAEPETDLPACLVDTLNGLGVPSGLPDQIRDWAMKTGADKNEKCFFDALATLLEIFEDENLNSTLGQLGYTLWENDKLHIKGFFNEKTALKPNEVIRVIYNAVDSKLRVAIEEKTYKGERSLEDCAKDEDWTDGFQLNYSTADFDAFSTDYYIDRGDLNIIIAAMRAVRAVVQFLYAQDLNGMTIPELIDEIGGFAENGITTPTFVGVLVRIGELLKKVSVRTPSTAYKPFLMNAQKFIVEDGVLPNMERGDEYIRNSRFDTHAHLFGRLTETGEPPHAVPYDPENSIIALIRDHVADLKKLFTETGYAAPLVYTSWLKGVLELPNWLDRDAYRVSLAPVFSTGFKWADILPHYDGEWLKPESVEDPTLGGILPDMSADEMNRILLKFALTGFDECPAISEHITTPETYAKFRAWASGFSHDEVVKLRGSLYAYQSYEMRSAVEPHVFESEPKVEISEVSVGTMLQMTVKITDGDALVRAIQAIEDSVQTCSDLSSGGWGKAQATAVVNADGTATIKVASPSGTSGFVRVHAR